MPILFSISKQKTINKHLRFKTERNFWQGTMKPEPAKSQSTRGNLLSYPKATSKTVHNCDKAKGISILETCDTSFFKTPKDLPK